MKDKEKGDATLHDMGYTDEQIAQLREPDFCGRIGFPDYMLANNNANIRRLEGRIKSLQKTKSQGTRESENKFFKVKENVEAMRIQLFFEGKPEPEVRDILKSNGFRWAPSVGAWQRQLNNNGKYAVERVIRELEEMEEAEKQSEYWMQEEHLDTEKSDSYEAEADRLYEEVYKLSNQVADFIVSLTSGQIDKVMAMTMMRQRREDVERILEAA